MKIVYIFLYVLVLSVNSCMELPDFNNPNDPSNPYGSISGRITDNQSGLPIQGVTITTDPATSITTSNASGNFTISYMVPGSYSVTASKLGYVKYTIPISITSGNLITLEIKLTSTYGTITGKIRDSYTSLGIQGVTVTTEPATITVTTDASGDYSIPNLNPRSYAVNASKSGYTTNTVTVNVTGGITSTANISLNPFVCPSTITDTRNNKVYNTVIIGSQCWLKENLDIGTMIPGTQMQINNSTIEKYCYNDDPANCTTFGGLYKWYEAMQYVTTTGAQGICPTGWHIPTYSELQALSAAVGNDGNALKAIGQGIAGGAGTNTSGFSALLGGYINDYGNFSNFEINVNFYSSSIVGTSGAYYLNLYRDDSSINLNYVDRTFGFSVRCLKD